MKDFDKFVLNLVKAISKNIFIGPGVPKQERKRPNLKPLNIGGKETSKDDMAI